MSQLLEASDSDLSLELSDGSSLSSDSEHSVDTKRTPKKDTKKYCVCRQGYNGKEFMIECEHCQGKTNKRWPCVSIFNNGFIKNRMVSW
jgi:hypothetical protein